MSLKHPLAAGAPDASEICWTAVERRESVIRRRSDQDLAIGPGFHPELVGAVFPLLMLACGTAVAGFRPDDAIYFWMLAFGGLLVRRLLKPRRHTA